MPPILTPIGSTMSRPGTEERRPRPGLAGGNPGRLRPGRLRGALALVLVFGAGCLVRPVATRSPGVAEDSGNGGALMPVPGADVKRIVGASGLPVPAKAGVPKPTGLPGNLKVLPWAGFKAAVSWTLDDSQPSHLAHYAELQAVGVPMTFYINPGNDSGSAWEATWKQAVTDGHEIGNHTVHHCHSNLTGCTFGKPLASAGDEFDDCSAYIPAHTGQAATWTAAPPFGDSGFNDPARSRFLANRGVGDGMIGPDDATDPFNLPIHMAVTSEKAGRFNHATEVALGEGKWIIFLLHTLSPTDAVWYNPVAITDATRAMAFAKALPDVWTDTVVAIAAYWRAQKLLASVTPAKSGPATTWTWTLPPHFPPGKFLRVVVDGGTLTQAGKPLVWDDHGYYEVALDPGAVTLAR